MSIQDVLKKSFLNQFNSDLSTTSIVGTLILTALIGTYIFVIYRAVCRKAFYSKSFAISLPVISMITASIIISIQSSVVISPSWVIRVALSTAGMARTFSIRAPSSFVFSSTIMSMPVPVIFRDLIL